MTIAEPRLRTCLSMATLATAYIVRENSSTAGKHGAATMSGAHPVSRDWAGQQRVNRTGEGPS